LRIVVESVLAGVPAEAGFRPELEPPAITHRCVNCFHVQGRLDLVNAIGKSRSELETEVSQAVIRFEKEFMGRGPLEARAYLLGDLLLVRLKGVLTTAEIRLAETGSRERGCYLLKQVRQELLERGRPLLETVVKEIVGVGVKSLHTDISTRTGERIIAFTLEGPPEL
jgi:uncharacterized protein YbcI